MKLRSGKLPHTSFLWIGKLAIFLLEYYILTLSTIKTYPSHFNKLIFYYFYFIF